MESLPISTQLGRDHEQPFSRARFIPCDGGQL